MNKKGFTMIELLAVIVILGLLLGVGIPAVNKVLANFRIDYYKKLEGTLATAGQEFISDKRYQKPTELMYSRVITKEELVGGKYIDEILDYKENECAGSYVVVAKIGDKHYEYQACLKCETDEYETDTSNKEYDLCNIAWQDNENIDYGAVNDKEKLWVYYGTPANEIKNELGLSYGITKKDSEGKVIAQAEGMENKIVYPNNINELVSANLDKEVTLRYELPTGESVNRKAEMYRFSVPTVSLKYGANNVATGKHTGDTYTQGEWTSSLNVTIGYNEKDKEKYRDFIEQSTKFTVEWYNQTTKKWEIGATCNTKGLTSCTWNINRDFNAVTKFRIKDYKGHPSMETGNYKLQVDVQKPSVTLTRQTYNTYNWTATEKGESGLRGYRYSTSNTVPTSYTTSGTINSGSKTISSEATNYVWVVDRAGNANSASIASYTVKRSQGAGTSLTTKYETSSGTTFTSNLVVLNGTKIYVSGTSSAGYSGIVVKKNGTAITNNAQTTISANSTISSEATICAAGSYSGAGAASCTKCPVGTYSSGTGSTSCTNCATGYESGEGATTCTKKTFTITYNGNGSTGGSTASTSCKYNETCTLRNNGFKRTGYFFTGWYTSASGGTKYGSTTKLTSNITVYAQWTKITMSISNPTNGNWTNRDIVLSLSTSLPAEKVKSWYYSYANITPSLSNVGSDDTRNWVKHDNSSGKKSFNTTPYSAERNQLSYIMVCSTDNECIKESTRIRIDKTAPYYSSSESRDCDHIYYGYYHCYMPIIRDNLSGVNSRCISTSGGENHCDNYGGIMAVSDELNTTSYSIWWDYSSACDIAGNCRNLGRHYHSW